MKNVRLVTKGRYEVAPGTLLIKEVSQSYDIYLKLWMFKNVIFSLLTNAIENDSIIHKNRNYSNIEKMVLINGLGSVATPKPECQRIKNKIK